MIFTREQKIAIWCWVAGSALLGLSVGRALVEHLVEMYRTEQSVIVGSGFSGALLVAAGFIVQAILRKR
jgi:hypothetical protein